MKIFDDDIIVYRKITICEDCALLQEDLARLWKMNLNPQKCELLCAFPIMMIWIQGQKCLLNSGIHVTLKFF